MALEVFEPGVAPVQRGSQALLVANGIELLLFRVGGDVEVSHQFQVLVDGGQEPHAFQCPVDRDLGHLHTHRGKQGDLAGDFFALCYQVVVGHEPGDHPNPDCLVSVDGLAGEQQLLGPAQPDAEGGDEKGRAYAGPYFRLTQRGASGRDHDVTDVNQFASPRRGNPVDSGDDRLDEVPDHHEYVYMAHQVLPENIRLLAVGWRPS